MQDLNPDICKMLYKKVKYKRKQNTYQALQTIEESLIGDSPSPSCRGRKPKVITNTYYNYFNKCVDIDKLRNMDRNVEDVLVGVSRLNWYRPTGESKPLSVKKLVYLFTELKTFTTKTIADKLEVGEKQGQRYLRACCMIIENLDRLVDLPYDPIDKDILDFDDFLSEGK